MVGATFHAGSLARDTSLVLVGQEQLLFHAVFVFDYLLTGLFAVYCVLGDVLTVRDRFLAAILVVIILRIEALFSSASVWDELSLALNDFVVGNS